MSEALYTIPAADLLGVLPELVLVGAGVLILLLDAFFKGGGRLAVPVGILSTLTAAFYRWDWSARSTSFGGLLESGPLTTAIGLVVLLALLLALLASAGYLRRQDLRAAEYTVLMVWCGAGLLLMARATELLTLFVALELLSICLYTLAAYHRQLTVSLEAGIKYFLMGAFVSAFILLGIALLYGETGTTNLLLISGSGPRAVGSSFLGSVGLLFLICGFGFKMSVAPFHAWSPDTYQGAPSPFVAFLSVAPKAASAVVLLRLLELVSFHGLEGRWPQLIAGLAVLSMVVGNVLALAQRDLKRMLAYSGIAHMGYLLIPLVGIERIGYEAVIIYILAYALMNAGAFSVVTLLYANPGEQHLISDLGGWGYRFPLLGVCLTICLLSLAGIPPTLGFIGKYLVFLYALEEGYLWLALVVVLTTLIGVFYYLRVVYTLYMRPQVRETDGVGFDLWGRLAAVVAALGSLALGIWPARILEWASQAARAGY